jgi:O-antigen/teichoic acid export membrane protein
VLPAEAGRLIAMACGVILFRNLFQMLLSIVQSQERAALRSGLMLAERYLVLGFTLLFAAVFRWGLTGFFAGILVAEGLLFLYTLVYALRNLHWRPRVLDAPVVRESMLYGLPLLGLNVSGFVTDWGDRYLLSYFREAAELGLYVAGYNLANYATMFFVPALNSALIPVTMNAWNEGGPEETRRSLESYLRWYSLVALPVVFGIAAVAEPLIRLIASEKFVAAAVVIPWVLAAKAVQGAYYPFLAGLFLSKRTGVLALFMAGAAVLNLALNWALIPGMGMTGAAIATLAAYIFYVLGGGVFSQRTLRLRFPVASFAAYLVAAGAMFGALRLVPDFASSGLTLAAKIPLGAVVYVAVALVLDREARGLVAGVLRRRG